MSRSTRPRYRGITTRSRRIITRSGIWSDNLGNNTGNAFQYNAPSDLRITGGNTDWGGAGNTGWAGGNQAHNNVGPRVYFNFLMKL